MLRLFEKLFSNGGNYLATRPPVNGGCKVVDEQKDRIHGKPKSNCDFQMPLHYPRYKKGDYEKMVEWQLDCLLASYGLPVSRTLEQKRKYAIGAFLWE